ncbi:DUF1365 domain-containing protein [Rubinisphaera margarita]|uniref:DUF1365 domain-containing protein n=1 Tax=Rubinisphaera margarita TaxID=2909586 RepID=UPI001EE8C0EC|nr:DUF1365 domain-containing protein [Rubinisphaera margarita]MCG6155440.1 DUF1365 domain-containing protein [Rubinisphaera margarita]
MSTTLQPTTKSAAKRSGTRSSCLYVGQVSHARLRPHRHSFRYSLFMAMIDLEELPELFDDYWLWSFSRWNVATFRRDDHLGAAEIPLDDAVRDLVEERLGLRPEGKILLLTHLRYFGFAMNPVSFYYCYDGNNDLVALVAEVNNTPWGEQHCYVHRWESDENGIHQQSEAKAFHVSPFMDMEMEYRWQVIQPDERLSVRIENVNEEGLLFSATLNMKRQPWRSRSLAGCLLRFPVMTLQVWMAIYWQALRLWMRQIRYVPHPQR